MILKRNFNPFTVAGYIRTELLISLGVSVAVYVLYHQVDQLPVLPFSISAILGSALAIFIAFRNNNAYSRWWEARTLWGGIVNSSRVMARLIITFTDSHSRQPGYDAAQSNRFKQEMVHLLLAWVNALRMQLRRKEEDEKLKEWMTEADWKWVVSKQHWANAIHLLTGQKIYDAMANGVLAGFDSFQLEGQLLALANYQGGCERIKNTPLLRQYAYFTRVFLLTFVVLLPFSLMPDFSRLNTAWLMIPISVLISSVFAIMNKVGEVNEDPFENRITDVPLDALCNTLERDLREMLGETNIPPRAATQNGFLY